MRRSSGACVVAVLALALAPAAEAADRLPTRIGQCVATSVKEVSFRLGEDVGGKFVPQEGSGSAVTLTNGGYQVSYDQIPAVDGSKPGDPVRMCLVSYPSGCPRGDRRGIIYKTTNERTHGSWTLPDSEHSCGGA